MRRIIAHSFANMDLLTFNPKIYSKFKYGCLDSSIEYGIELGKAIEEWIKLDVKPGQTVMLTGAPYNKIPVASTALTTYAVMYLQSKFSDITFIEFKVNREHSYHVDYGSMSAEERESLISAEIFTCDSDLTGNHVIFIDDIVITGAHERNMDKMAEHLNLYEDCLSVNFGYFAMLTNAECCPTIEADLNYAYVSKDGENIHKFLRDCQIFGDLIVNTRLTKFILTLEDEHFDKVLLSCSKKFLTDLYKATLANNYHNLEQYKTNFNSLQDIIQETYGFS